MKKQSLILSAFFIMAFLLSCKDSTKKQNVNFPHIDYKDFEKGLDEKDIRLFYIANQSVSVAITNYGARIAGLSVPDRKGEQADVVLGFSGIDDYLDATETVHGALIGRYANRIAGGKLIIKGVSYQLPLNNNKNHLHGGPEGFHTKVWDIVSHSDTSLILSYVSKDGEMGYPGTLSVKVIYTATYNNALEIQYHATTDKTTTLNLSNHAFFNLSGAGEGTIHDHILSINADSFTPVNDELIPTGEILPVEGTPLDFRNMKTIGEDLETSATGIKNSSGYDNNYVLNKKTIGELSLAASLVDPKSGRKMDVFTTEPGMQFFSGNGFSGKTIGKNGKNHPRWGGLALETQHFPDSPNHEHFPSTILNPEEEFKSTTIYRFSIADN